MATAEKRVVTDATGQAMLAELRKIPGVMNPVPVEKGGTGVTTPEGIRELINAQEKFDFDVEEELNKRAKSVNGILPDELGNIQVLHVAEADNFSSDEAQTISGTFIERTTGGDASIHDGTANLTALYGYSVRSGYSEETKSFQVIPTGRLDDSEPISAEINWSTYKTAVNNVSTNKTFTYGVSGWNENPETYGITVSGTPATGDVMNVYFTAEVRGTIANTTPQTFVETGWNLYNHTNGYARVLKYSEDYGFKIGGTYTGIAFAETVEGAQTVLTPGSNGIFTVPSDGYVFVTGGNDTDTFILMTWSDWGEGYTGEFETYSESVVDLSELMSNAFPYGMCNIGIVYDEINFNDKTAYVRIERQAYTAENLINAEATGRAFTYDVDYIYIVKETPEKIRFNISSEVTVYDHGTEYFTGTDLPVLTYQLFGQNLKDKLRREVVAVTPQNFSIAQKAIARQNIDAAFDQEVIKTINHKTPDQYGDITIVEGTANASYGLYRINATIQPAAWSLVNGAYQIAYADPLIKSDMDGMETWLDNPEAMKGKTRFTTIDGALIISTAVQPTETWSLHVALGTNGATVLEQVANKAEENTVALVEHDDTAFHSIAVGQYVLWKGVLYQATAAITAGDTLAATGNSANLTAKSDGIGNEMKLITDSLFDRMTHKYLGAFTSEANLATALTAEVEAMTIYTEKVIRFSMSNVTASFKANHYYGLLSKAGSNANALILLYNVGSYPDVVNGSETSAGVWVFYNHGKHANGLYINDTTVYSSFADIMSSGYYRIGTTFLGDVSDKPSNAGGILVVTRADVMYQQTFYPSDGSVIYTRFKAGSNNWTAWTRIGMRNDLVVQKVSLQDVTVNASTGKTVAIDVSKSGYTPLGLVGVDHNGTIELLIGKHSITSSTAYVSLYNMKTSAQSSLTVTAVVLYRVN